MKLNNNINVNIIKNIYKNDIIIDNIKYLCKFAILDKNIYNIYLHFINNNKKLSQRLNILIKNNKCFDKGMEIAAKYSDDELINFYINNGAKLWNMGIKGAAEGGNIRLIKFFVNKIVKDYTFNIGPSTYIYNDYDIYTADNKYISNMGFAYGAKGGHLDVVKFFYNNGADDIKWAIDFALYEFNNKNKNTEKYREVINFLHLIS